MMASKSADIFKAFGLSVDLSDPRARAFLEGSGIPQKDWLQFERTNRTPAERTPYEVESAPPDSIPPELRELGVTAVDRRSSGVDVRYLLTFNDGESLLYHLSLGAWDETSRTGRELIQLMVAFIQVKRVLPFSE